ncbi:hypothetical protein FYJ80_02100 [Spirochaetales bacterium NM-380-WT-3C1]|uniref:Lipoprotein n=1 Tax=Bullifex porci TaxID=2606638 RepID=A0A7X2PBY7_9SPIO|nr:hypothetical protein [Bullifex porci]MSU05575.1 hypothetical protein [Bullifex porci]
MKKLLIIILTIVSLVALASCNIPIPEPPVPDEIKDVLEQEPAINQIDKVLDKIFIADGSPVALEGYPVISFKILKDISYNYTLEVQDEGNRHSISITIENNKYYCGDFELKIKEELDTINITIGGKVYGPAE